ncbi:MAG: hypothetical protein IJ598_02745 [Ruminococcus sp.]|nr:hypothetical protein [Ruminococcus sp.]
MKPFVNSRDSPIVMEVKQLQFTREGKSMNIYSEKILDKIAVGCII